MNNLIILAVLLQRPLPESQPNSFIQPIKYQSKSLIFSGAHTEKLISLIEKSLFMLSCCYLEEGHILFVQKVLHQNRQRALTKTFHSQTHTQTHALTHTYIPAYTHKTKLDGQHNPFSVKQNLVFPSQAKPKSEFWAAFS